MDETSERTANTRTNPIEDIELNSKAINPVNGDAQRGTKTTETKPPTNKSPIIGLGLYESSWFESSSVCSSDS